MTEIHLSDIIIALFFITGIASVVHTLIKGNTVTNSDFLVAIIYSIAIFGAIKVCIAWLQGRINSPVAWEWFLRGFFMAWGVMTCLFVVLLVIKLVMKMSN